MLREEGVRARPFHRGLRNTDLDKTMQQWLDGSVECVVSRPVQKIGHRGQR